jgi:3-hydroxyisobutyrate dehydrogenase-like beta-hydroxyacid dehydrogenase
MRIGMLGVGRMGAPIARALAEQHAVTAYDPASSGWDWMAAAGVKAADSARAAMTDADVLLTVLPGAAEFAAAADGALESLPRGALWIDLTSNDPRAAERVAAAAADRGIRFAAAPMSGGPDEAHARRLRFWLSGDPESVRAARDLLEELTRGAPATGGPPAGGGGITVAGTGVADATVVKLLSNLLWFGQVVAVSEAMLLGRSMGLDPARLLDLLAEGPGSGVVAQGDFAAVLRGDYLAHFGLDRVAEELETVSSIAAEQSVPFELSDLVRRTHEEALKRFGAIDGELLAARLLEERAGDPLGPA